MKALPTAERSSTREFNILNTESQEEIEFREAIEKYKKQNKRPFPAWSEVLEIARSLGYRIVMPKKDLPTYKKLKEKFNL